MDQILGSRPARTGPVWVARLTDHKNAHRGMERTVYFSPKAQLILRRLMVDDHPLFKMHHDTLAESLRSVCRKAKVPHFTPYAMRHTRLTAVCDALGIEAAHAIGGRQSHVRTQ